MGRRITDEHKLEAWLKEMPAEFACVLATRSALRVAPVLGQALREEEEERRRALILPGFRALAAANFAGTWPTRLAEVRTAVRSAGREAGDAAAEIGNAARMSVFEAKDAIPEMHEYVGRLEGDARALGIAERAVDAAMHALQAAVDAVDADQGIASPDAASESCVAATEAACNAIDGVNGYAEFLAGLEKDGGEETPVATHIAEFWQAVDWDTRFLKSGAGRRGGPEELVARLSQSALWPEGIPVWVGRRWADLKDDLPEAEGWSDWVDWYEGRLTGRPADEAKEFQRMTSSNAGRRRAPGENGEQTGRKTNDRGPLASTGAHSAHEYEDRERRYFLEEGFGRYVTASQFARLPTEEQIACMVRWFHRMYEDPANETPYDSGEGGYIYIWGGPYEARDEIGDEFRDLVSDEVIEAAVSKVESDGVLDWAPTDSNPKHRARLDDDEEADRESPPPTLDEIRDRLASGHAPRFGDPLEAEGRKALRNEIGRLRDALEPRSPEPAGIGHNRPPESLSLSADETEEVREALNELDEETSKDVPDVDAVVESTDRVGKVLGWLGRKLDVSVDSFMKTLGALGAGAVVAAFAGFPLLETLARVYRAALKWLDAVLPLF